MADSQEKSDMNTILFTNLQLLGLDVIGMEASYKIPFNKDMFNLPNKAGSEAVLYFLFNRLNPSLCKEQFRDCWPVLDKKTELQFRKVCNSWLTSIQREDAESRLPRVNAALLLSPGGGKFIHLLYILSTHVLVNIMKSEHGWKVQDSIKYPILQPRTAALGTVMRSAVHDSLIREKNQFIENLYLTIDANRQWKDYTNELVKDFRGLTKSNRDLEHEKRKQVNILADNCIKQGVSLPAKRTITMFDSDQDSAAIAREQRLQKIKSQWKSLTEFNDRVMEAREVFHSVVDNEASSCVLDGTDIGVRVPGLLLKERSEEIHKRGIDNVYNAGALNLVSLVQLWNVSLNMYKEQLQSESLPSVSTEVPQLRTQAHEHHSHLRHIQKLREALRNNTLPKLRNSIVQLQKQLNNQCIAAASTDKDTNLGLILTAPTPPMAAVTRKSLQVEESSPGLVAGVIADTGSTPDALQNVTSTIETAVQKRVGASMSLKGVPTLPRLKSGQNRPVNGINVHSRVPKSHVKKDILKSAKSQYNTKIPASKKSVDVGLRENTSVRGTESHETMQAYQNQGNSVAMSTSSITPRSSKRSVMDILADTIVDSVLNSSDSTLLSDASVDTLLEFGEFGAEAFQTINLIGRSPVKGNTSFHDVEHLQASPACRNKIDHCNNDDFNLSLIHESFDSLGGKIGSSSCDSHSEANDWSNNASKEGISRLHTGHIPRSGMQRSTGIAESASVLSTTGDFMKSVSEAESSGRVQLLDCVVSHSERTPKRTRLDEWDKCAISKSLTHDQSILNCLGDIDKPAATHTDNDELLIPQVSHSVSSFVSEDRMAIESSMTSLWKDDIADMHLQFPKTSKHNVQYSPLPTSHPDYQNPRKTTDNLAEVKSLHVSKRRFDIEDFSDRQPGDGQDDWGLTAQPVPVVVSGKDSDAETEEESVEDRRDSGSETGESADVSVLHRLAPISIELRSISASDILSATQCNILENSHDEEIVSSDYHNVPMKENRNSLTAKMKLQLDTESQLVLDSCGTDLIFNNSHNGQLIQHISSGSSFQDYLQLEGLDTKIPPSLISLDSEEDDGVSEETRNDSFIPFKQGKRLDSRSPFKQSLTPSKADAQSSTMDDQRLTPGKADTQSSTMDDQRLTPGKADPTSVVSSSDSIQTKLAQLHQKVLDILGGSSDDSEVEEQPGPKSSTSETTAACGISPDDDDILSTDLLNTDLLGGMEDFM